MASSVDFKRILERYNQEGKTRGVSIVTFCQQNGVEYSIFERWYRNRNKSRLHPVRIVNEEPAQVASVDADIAIKDVRGAGYGPETVVVGHDVSRIIAMAMMHVYHRKDLKGTTDKQVEAAFRLAYHKEYFVKTALYAELAKVRDEVQIAFI